MPVTGKEEDRSAGSFPEIQIDGPRRAWGGRDGDVFAAFADNRQCAMPAADVHGFCVGAEGFADSEPVQREQRDQRVVALGAEPGPV